MLKSTAKSLYRNVIAEAWRTTWNHTKLWLWGLFAALLGNEGEYKILSLVGDRVSNGQFTAGTFEDGLSSLPASTQAIPGFFHAVISDPKSTFFLVLISLIVIAAVILIIWLTAVAVVALITGTVAVANKKPIPAYADAVATGSEYFKPVFVLYIMGRALSWCLLTLLVLFAALTVIDYLIGFPVFIVGFLVIVPVLFIISFIVRYATMYVVLRRQGLLQAIENAIDLFQRQWLITLEVAFILLVINLLASVVMVLLIGLLVLPLLIAAMIAWQAAFVAGAISLASFGVLLLLLILCFFGSVLATFQWAAWTNVFLKLRERGHLSKIVRVVGRWYTDHPVRLFGRA